jgi:hypothetical protein
VEAVLVSAGLFARTLQRRSHELLSRAEFLVAMERAGLADRAAVNAALDLLLAEEELLVSILREVARDVADLDKMKSGVLP